MKKIEEKQKAEGGRWNPTRFCDVDVVKKKTKKSKKQKAADGGGARDLESQPSELAFHMLISLGNLIKRHV